MRNPEEKPRTVALCENCGAAFAAVVLDDGGIEPMGLGDGCGTCGATEFEPMNKASQTSPSETTDADDD